jgi:hypothetical protein
MWLMSRWTLPRAELTATVTGVVLNEVSFIGIFSYWKKVSQYITDEGCEAMTEKARDEAGFYCVLTDEASGSHSSGMFKE